MAAPSASVDTAAPPPPSTEPAAVPDQKVAHPPPPVPQPDAAPPAPAPAPAPRKRKLEDAGFHNSEYYKIRAIVADLRGRFVQVSQATDSWNSDTAREILKEIKVVMELSKKMRLNFGAISAPVKPSEKPPAVPVKDHPMKPSEKPSAGHAKDDSVKLSEVPSAGPVKDVPMKPSEEGEPIKPSGQPSAGSVKEDIAGPTPPGENNQTPQVGPTALPRGNESVDAATKHDSSESAAVQMEEETRPNEMACCP